MSPSTPPPRTRALSDLLARYRDDEDDTELNSPSHGKEGVLSEGEDDPGAAGAKAKKRVKLNGVDVSLLARDLGKWINADPNPQEAALDSFFIAPSPPPSTLLPSPSIDTSPTASSKKPARHTPSSSTSSSPSPVTPAQDADDEDHEPDVQRRASEGGVSTVPEGVAAWRGSPRGKVLIPKRAMQEWDESAEAEEDTLGPGMASLKL